jgi:hypothetical protein
MISRGQQAYQEWNINAGLKEVTMRRVISQVAAAILLCTAIGCAPTLGDVYKKVETLPSAKALVYIYRPSGIMGGAVYYDVKANGKVVTTLYRGSYYPYVTDPGEIEFSAKTEASDEVTIDAKANQTYFLRGSVGLGFFVGHPHLTVVSAEQAETEIFDCKLAPEPQSQ